MSDAVNWMLEVRHQLGEGGSGYGQGLLQWAFVVCDAINSTTLIVAIGVADIVLHVSDNDVVPIRYIKGAVLADNGIRRSEILICAHEEISGWFAPDFPKFSFMSDGFLVLASTGYLGHLGAAIAVEIVTLDTEEADRIADEIVVLIVIWEMGAGKNFACRNGANFLRQHFAHGESGSVDVNLIRAPGCSVGCVVVAPTVEADPM